LRLETPLRHPAQQNGCLFHSIEAGAEFYFSEDDYFSRRHEQKKSQPQKIKVKSESNSPSSGLFPLRHSSVSPGKQEWCSEAKKRPRRVAAETARSYFIPDSDDEAIAADDHELIFGKTLKKKRMESSLQLWIKHLTGVLKEEQQKVCLCVNCTTSMIRS
jgi:hypothetical protein